MSVSGRVALMVVVLASVALGACLSPTEARSSSVTGLSRFMPPDEYRGWWEATEACSSTSGDLDLVQWYHATTITRQGENVLGLWEPPHDITIRRDQETNAFVVQHEMLHELLRGDIDHVGPKWSECGLLYQLSL